MDQAAELMPTIPAEGDKVCMIDMDDTLYDYLGQLRRDL